MYVCMHALMYVCMYVCVYVYMHVVMRSYLYLQGLAPGAAAYNAALRACRAAGQRWQISRVEHFEFIRGVSYPVISRLITSLVKIIKQTKC